MVTNSADMALQTELPWLPGLIDGFWVSLAVRVAWSEGVFESLAAGPRSVSQLAAVLDASERGLDAIAGACAHAGLIMRQGRHGCELSLTPGIAAQVLRDSFESRYPLLALCERGEEGDSSYLRLRRAFRRNEAQHATAGGAWLELLSNPGDARLFLRAMSAQALGVAAAWTRRLNLGQSRHLLDVGGGAGDHARCLVQNQPTLQVTILERAQVVKAAEHLGFGQHRRIDWHIGDFWQTPWPEADTHLLSDVLHDWSRAQGLQLLRNSFEQLPAGGRIIVHEQLLDSMRDGPFDVLASNLCMLVWTEGQQYTALELSQLLCEAGFRDVAVLRTLRNWFVATGIKS